jgi:serine/threonine-protein kinase
MKPANIIVIPDPNLGQLVKILNFGITKLLNSSTPLKTKGFYVTLPYCSLEKLEGVDLDSRSDIYSLAVMMFEMLTGQNLAKQKQNILLLGIRYIYLKSQEWQSLIVM